ncbi:MAG: hypothetical protein UX10_C0012G0006 [Candidatus Magasanikbacteria bacterium GW2011_GWA2_45_39]|uniref:Uncharacterized protein n=2 Tax=Candidatus Magasanikiibacteriota TaxID=1752731 RepID=A0A0G1QXE8_9BACT|nr:MAG: hypothetical protein UX10_C0012G0006 [Candidatus Magasanikbacteria bacterium GW2011_GWA2_45_39]KKU13350.1 MAG: hypothetical protein UX20_C0024G0010 [Candidatus Magasanikbacteria bacterium GW2011_GWC2_45_8]
MKKFYPDYSDMTDKIQKSLDVLSEKEKEAVKNLLIKIKTGRLLGVDLKKLKGREDIYRARKGKIRIIYRTSAKGIYLLAIERRSENTYLST